MKVDLSGRVALVTGAATGIGKACAEALVANGATVVFSDRDEARAKETAGNRGDVVVIDVADRQAIADGVAQTLQRHGRIDILVNNAGIGVRAADRKTVDEFPVEAWDEMLAVDLTGVFLMSRAVAAAMKARRSGAIVNIASVLGLVPMRLQSSYVAAKAGVVNLTRGMAIELAKDGVRVNAVAPGSTATEGWQRWIQDPSSEVQDLHKSLMSHIPMGRPASTQEIANGVLFLSSPAASYVTGHTLVIDGGWTAGYARDW
ncbi:MAG: SDR family oxidoreductase [Alphaproteobacteria bacterium]|nr:SDR family oxidoreductase [Alphaproteobacteria bacterium]